MKDQTQDAGPPAINPELIAQMMQRAVQGPSIDVESLNALIRHLLILTELEIQDQKRRRKQERVEDVLARAFPKGIDKLRGPIREVVALLYEE